MEDKKQTHIPLRDQLSQNTTPDGFEKIIAEIVNAKDREILGADANKRLSDTLLALAAFAPSPASFDEDAFEFQACVDDGGEIIPKEQVDYLLQRIYELGVFSVREDGRLLLDPEAGAKLDNILAQYE